MEDGDGDFNLCRDGVEGEINFAVGEDGTDDVDGVGEEIPAELERDSLSPDRDRVGGLLSYIRRRNFSGKSLARLEGVPDLDRPLTDNAFADFIKDDYFDNGDFSQAEIRQILAKKLVVNERVPGSGNFLYLIN